MSEHIGEKDDGDARRIPIDGRLIFTEDTRRRCHKALTLGILDIELMDTLSQMVEQRYSSHQATYYMVKMILPPSPEPTS